MFELVIVPVGVRGLAGLLYQSTFLVLAPVEYQGLATGFPEVGRLSDRAAYHTGSVCHVDFSLVSYDTIMSVIITALS